MINKFIQVAQTVETNVNVIPETEAALNEILNSIINDQGKIVISEFQFTQKKLLNKFINTNNNIISHPTDNELAKAKYGITDAFAGIAETGSVCVLNDDSMSGSYSLFVNTHIAIVNSKDIVARPRNIFQSEPYKSIALSKDFVFISGSSATADMGPLVRGVHGPAKLHVIILE